MSKSPTIEFIARAVIIKNKKILLCWGEQYNVLYFPGGHIEFGEKAETALKRELKEESGQSSSIGPMIGIVQNTFNQNGTTHHEVNLVFTAKIPKTTVISQESHVNFRWVSIEDFKNTKTLPLELKNRVIRWQKDKKPFQNSQGFKNQ